MIVKASKSVKAKLKMQLYPMLFQPVFKDYLWGGRRLEHFGRELPEDTHIAESWEIAAHEDGMTVVTNGELAGKSLQSVLNLLGKDLIGTHNQWALDVDKFPLLVKLLDAHQKLSLQVHPGDAYAREHEHGELGKTEMWVVLEAAPGAAIIYGLADHCTREELVQAIKHGNLSPHLNRIPIQPGDHICVPSGTLHAILAGAVIAEIQQNSNVTYRVYDWDRVGTDGQPRALHVEQALDVINYELVAPALSEPEVLDANPAFIRQRLCQNPYFTTERFLIQPGETYTGCCDGRTLEIWGVIEGNVDIAGLSVSPVRFVLLPASLGTFTILAQSNAVLLRTYMP